MVSNSAQNVHRDPFGAVGAIKQKCKTATDTTRTTASRSSGPRLRPVSGR